MMITTNIAHDKVKKITIIVTVGCLLLVFFSGFNTIKSRYYDMQRRSAMETIVKALEIYHDKYGIYPEATDNWQGWDLSTSYDGSEPGFLERLYADRIISKMMRDPINDAAYHYRYRKYEAGAFGCKNAFYILQVTNFELATQNNGKGQCSEFNWVEIAPNGYTVQNFD